MTQEELVEILDSVSILTTPFQDGSFYVEAYEPEEDFSGCTDWRYTLYVDGICVHQSVRVWDIVEVMEDEGYSFDEEAE